LSAALALTTLFALWIVLLQVPSAFVNPSLLLTDDPVTFQRGRGGLTSLCVAIGMWGAASVVASSLTKRDPVVAETKPPIANVGADARA
jgi:hypothetical protein